MSRLDTSFEAAGEAELNDEELAELLARGLDSAAPARSRAIACYLSASEGWQDAVKALGGAFAPNPSATARLSGDKAE